MSRPPVSLAVLVTWVFCAVGLAQATASGTSTRPNIVLILADDMGIGDVGVYNPDSKIATSRLDMLAAQGMRFTDAHSPSAVCTPTRYGILTGRYAWRSRLKSWVLDGYGRSLIEPGRSTIAGFLATHGYATACSGKWHLGLGLYDPAHPDLKADYDKPFDAGPHTAGFSRSVVLPASLDFPPYVYVRDGRVVEAATARTDGSKRRWDGGGGFWRAGPMAPGFDFQQVLPLTTDRAVEYIAAGAGKPDEPFFLYVPMSAPHTPWMPTAAFQGTSHAGWYGDFVSQVDAEVGRILDALEQHGLSGDTIVIVTSDNGAHWRPRDVTEYGHHANLHYRGMKADIFEAGHRIPLIVRWPGRVAAGATSDALIGLHDLYATIAELLNAELLNATPGDGDAPDSVSFACVLRGTGKSTRESIVHHSGNGTFALRVGRWKLIDGLGSGGFTRPARVKPQPNGPTGQLYDLEADPGETRNLLMEKPEVVARLRKMLAAERAK